MNADGSPEFEAYLECTCRSKEHIVALEYDKEWGLQLHFQGNQFQNIFKRLLVAIKFVFGIRRGYSFWDDTLVSEEGAKKIQEWLDLAKKNGYEEKDSSESFRSDILK